MSRTFITSRCPSLSWNFNLNYQSSWTFKNLIKCLKWPYSTHSHNKRHEWKRFLNSRLPASLTISTRRVFIKTDKELLYWHRRNEQMKKMDEWTTNWIISTLHCWLFSLPNMRSVTDECGPRCRTDSLRKWRHRHDRRLCHANAHLCWQLRHHRGWTLQQRGPSHLLVWLYQFFLCKQVQ